MFLLDVNVLIALVDQDHIHHDLAENFFRENSRLGWATCPLIENGFLRIFGHPRYPQGPGSTRAAREVLRDLVAHAGHQFWPDSLSLTDTATYPELPGSQDITDYYLLALAIHHQARLATLDQRIDPALLPRGLQSFLPLPFS